MNKEKWIDEVLQSGRNITPVEVNPFLHTRIESRLQQDKAIPRIQTGWVYALSTIMTVALILNIYVWFNTQSTKTPAGVQQVIQEYGWSVRDVYSLNYSK